MAIIKCKKCGIGFKTYRLKRKFCSYICAMKADWNTKDKMGIKNISNRNDVRKKMSIAKIGKTGKKSNAWKGDLVSYYAKHIWIKQTWGKPIICEHCGENGTNHRIEWANKSGLYNREKRGDWIMLCTPCHRKFDYSKKHFIDSSLQTG